jgi:hypothetical protein
MPAAVKVYMNPKALTNAARAALPRILKRQGAYVKRSMARSIRLSATGKPAPVGAQPLTHNKLLRRSIQFGVDMPRESVVIGPDFRMAGIMGNTHEFGGREVDNRIPGKKTGLFGRPKKKTPGWDLSVGGYGPIRVAQGKVHYGHLNTLAQVARAEKLAIRAERVHAMKVKSKGRVYPKRPFAGRTLERVANTGRLAEFWRDSIGPTGGTGIGQLI